MSTSTSLTFLSSLYSLSINGCPKRRYKRFNSVVIK